MMTVGTNCEVHLLLRGLVDMSKGGQDSRPGCGHGQANGGHEHGQLQREGQCCK